MLTVLNKESFIMRNGVPFHEVFGREPHAPRMDDALKVNPRLSMDGPILKPGSGIESIHTNQSGAEPRERLTHTKKDDAPWIKY